MYDSGLLCIVSAIVQERHKVASLRCVTSTSSHMRSALALSGFLVTVVVVRSAWVTVAVLAAFLVRAQTIVVRLDREMNS